jgi:hypothetical protein
MGLYSAATYIDHISYREVLLFDKIYIRDFSHNLNFNRNAAPEAVATLEYFAGQGILVELPKHLIRKDLRTDHATRAPTPGTADPKEIANRLIGRVTDNTLRQWALTVEAFGEDTCVPLTKALDYDRPASFGGQTSRSVSVMDVIVRSLPVPTADIPAERIVEFRADPTVKRKLQLLRRWISRFATAQGSEREVREELESLLQDYEEYMKVQKMKYEIGAIRVLISTTLDIIENIARFRPKGAFDAIFRVREKQIQLLEAELKAPGREVAFLSMVREKL